MKVFFDTNVYVSEALLGGLAVGVMEAVRAAGWRSYASTYLLDECERVIHKKLGYGRRLALLTRRRIARRSTLVEPGESRHKVHDDPNDSPILRAALAAGVDYLVTNDVHLLSLDPYEGLRVISLKAFRQVLADLGLLG